MKQSTWRGEGEEERGRFSLLPLSLSLFHPLHRLVIFSVHWTNVVPVRSDAIIFGERDRRSRRGKKDFWPREQLFERDRRGRHAGFRSIIFLSLSPRFVFFFFFPLSLLSLLPPPLSSLFFRPFLPFRPATDVEWGSTMRGNRASGEFLLTAFETSRRGTLETDVWSIRDSFHIPDVSSTLNLNRESDKGRVYRAFYFRDSMKLRTLIYWNV